VQTAFSATDPKNPKPPAAWLGRLWGFLRQATGDDAYERYLAHCRTHHPAQSPLDRKAFHAAELGRRWNGIRRCC